jgi:hypothetical protein
MPVINFDEKFKSIKPVEFILNGKNYVVKEVSPETLDEIMATIEEIESEGTSIDEVNARQLSLLTGEPADDFRGLDVRKASMVLSNVMEAVMQTNKRRGYREKKRR